jgi:predicted ATP-grasp superfamily ATP-dependent carboligase
MGTSKTILITDITSYKASVIARYLKRHYPSLRIIATDHRSIARWACAKWVDEVTILSNRPEAGASYIEELRSLSASRNVDYLIPVNSKEMRQLMKSKARFSPALDYWGSAESFENLDDKDSFMSLLAKLQLPHPRNFGSWSDAIAPVVIKPRRGSSSKGVKYLSTTEEIAQAQASVGPRQDEYLIQQHIDGEGVGFSGFFKDGEIIAGYAHRRVAEWPTTGGSSVIREQYPYDDVDTLQLYVRKVAEATHWSGFGMFEFKRTFDGKLYFIECNPRIWGSINQGLRDGTNYFEALLGKPERPAHTATTTTRTELAPLSWAACVSYVLRAKWSNAKESFLSLWKTSYDINPLIDPLGFVALLLRGA